MEKQQRNKLIVGIGFILFFTIIGIFAFENIIIPNREKRLHELHGNKINLKTGYKTKVNPDLIDSMIRARKKNN
jgi:hypothetical protein